MKKISLFFAIFLTALSLGLTSCSTEDPAIPLSVNTSADKMATISGTLLINSDLTKELQSQKYEGMRSVNIIVTVSYKDIFQNAQAKGSWSTTVTTDTKGVFSVSVPSNETGVDVEFNASDVRGERKRKVGVDSKTFSGVWKFSIPSVNVKAKQTVIIPYVEGSFNDLKEDGSNVY